MTPDAKPPAGDQVRALLAAAVTAIGGSERPGQLAMAEAVVKAMDDGQHLLVQAGTGTGKSLAYLVPALIHAQESDDPVVVATATIALQRQLVERDLPALLGAVGPMLPRTPTFALLKGRRNYLCLNRLRGGAVDDQPEALFGGPPEPPRAGTAAGTAPGTAGPTSSLGREVKRLHDWAETTETGDRDELVPGVSERAWSQVAVSGRECVGRMRCPYGEECFSERARDAAMAADLVVTNHALLALDAMDERPVLPEHEVVVIDEAHELVDRVTGAATEELTATAVERAGQRAHRLAAEEAAALEDAGAELLAAIEAATAGELRALPEALAGPLAVLRDAARALIGALGSSGGGEGADGGPGDDAGRRAARVAAEAVFATATRLLADAPQDVAWLAVEERSGQPTRRALRVAPLAVAELLRQRLFDTRTAVLTSATLALGGTFEPVAAGFGLLGEAGERGSWRGIDVGSPFDYRRQGILYVARHLPPPGRDGPAPEVVDEIAELIAAAGGRTLGLFSSMRAAVSAAAAMRERLDVPVLCQGDDATGLLVRTFADNPRTCLFGTLSLWQGVDVPGAACQLVLVDRIPFPRPDDPLRSARQRAVSEAGGNGFMAVAAAHAALLLAQGSGRLVRSLDDRGVVAVLDSRLATARYAGFLRASMPPFWYTTDRDVARAALRRLDESASSSPALVSHPA